MAIAAAAAAAAVVAAFTILTSLVLAGNDAAQLDRRLDAIVDASIFPDQLSDPRRGVLQTGRSRSSGQVVFQRGLQLPALPPGTDTVAVNGVDYRVRTIPVDQEGGVLMSIGIRADSILLSRARIPLYIAVGVADRVARRRAGLAAGRPGDPAAAQIDRAHQTARQGHRADPRVRGVREAEDLSEAMTAMLGRLVAAQRATTNSLQAAQDFAANAAHELRTPLTAMRADLDTLRIHNLPEDERDEVVADLSRAQRRVEGIITALGQLASGQLAQAADREVIDVTDLLDRVARENMRVGRDVEIEVDAADDLGTIGAGPAVCGWRWTTWSATPSTTVWRPASCWPRTGTATRSRSSSTTTAAGCPPRNTRRCWAASPAAATPRPAARDSGWRWWPSRRRCTAAPSRCPTARSAGCARP